jgi:uncharacterized protein YnzC (UPF0291/DUF896 family)
MSKPKITKPTLYSNNLSYNEKLREYYLIYTWKNVLDTPSSIDIVDISDISDIRNNYVQHFKQYFH